MRMPPNLKYVLFIVLLIGVVLLGMSYLPQLVPDIEKILTIALVAGVGLFMMFTFIKPTLGFLYARADGLLAVYTDAGQQGIHVFAYHLNSGGDPPGASLRDILHYYIETANGKLYYHKLFSHEMEPVAGRSGWEGYTSFESSVLQSAAFERSLAKLSGKMGTILQPGKSIAASGNDQYSFSIIGKNISIKKFKAALDEGYQITCMDAATGTVLWKKKI